MAYGYLLEAEYESGYVHREQKEDHSPYVKGRNIFNDIVQRRPEKVHGRMIRFSLVGADKIYSIDWTKLPDNARPIYFRWMEDAFNVSTGKHAVSASSHHFGYQYNDEDGNNHQKVTEV